MRLKTHTIALVTILAASHAFGQDEPASELPEDDYGDEYGEAAPPPPSENAGTPPAEADDVDDTWQSYSDLARASSVAEDITDGVRVEDIVEPPSDYRYAAFGKPDPFVAPLVTQAEKIEAVDAPGAIEIPIVSMLQRHELSTLRVVGIYSVPSGERKALIVTPDAQQAAVSVKVGDPIGNRGGKVLAIGESTVTVREFTLGADGTRQYDDMEMFLGQPEDQAIGARIRFEPGVAKTTIIENDNVVKSVEEGVEERLEQKIQPTGAGQPGNAVPNAPAAPAAQVPGLEQGMPGTNGMPTMDAMMGAQEGIPPESAAPAAMPPSAQGSSMMPAATNGIPGVGMGASNTPSSMGASEGGSGYTPPPPAASTPPPAAPSSNEYEGYEY